MQPGYTLCLPGPFRTGVAPEDIDHPLRRSGIGVRDQWLVTEDVIEPASSCRRRRDPLRQRPRRHLRRRRRVRTVMDAAAHGWVIDGNYERKLDRLVTDAADTIVWLDLPLWILLHRLWRRTSHRIRGNVELWSGNRETWRTALWGRESLFVWTIRAFFRHRREWPRRFASHPGFVRLRTPQAAHDWLSGSSISAGQRRPAASRARA